MSNRNNRTLYAKVPELDNIKVSAMAWAVWAALCSFAKWRIVNGVFISSVPGKCIPRISVLAERAHMSESSVRRYLNELKELGLIAVVPRYEGKKRPDTQGEQRSNSYVLYPRGDAPKPRENKEEVSPERIARFRDMIHQGMRYDVAWKESEREDETDEKE